MILGVFLLLLDGLIRFDGCALVRGDGYSARCVGERNRSPGLSDCVGLAARLRHDCPASLNDSCLVRALHPRFRGDSRDDPFNESVRCIHMAILGCAFLERYHAFRNDASYKDVPRIGVSDVADTDDYSHGVTDCGVRDVR